MVAMMFPAAAPMVVMYGRMRRSDPASVALVSVMWANNEVGTLQPVEDAVAHAGAHGIPVHTDAVQAVGAVPVDFAASGVDALSLSGHKVGGPQGVGALVVRREVELTPLLHGGGQERDVRSGTLDPQLTRITARPLDRLARRCLIFDVAIGDHRQLDRLDPCEALRVT